MSEITDIRHGFVGIVVEERESVPEVNRILTAYASMIQGRIGVPDQNDGTAVIGLIVSGSPDQVGAMTGRLGNLRGIQVRSAMLSKKKKQIIQE